MSIRRVRQVLSPVADLALWVTATIGLIAAVASGVLFLHGARPLVVTSGSMEPTYPVRSVAVVTPIAAHDVHVGDVVAVSLPSGTRVLHRVADVRVTAAGIPAVTLKGDANAKPDAEPVVLTGHAYRAVAMVPYAGAFAMWLRTPVAGFAAALLLLGPIALRRRSPTTRTPSAPIPSTT